jgi:hypothetical protein
MASASLEPDTKDQKISYEVIREEDSEQVVKLLKETFFKVRTRKLDLFAVFIVEGSILLACLLFLRQTLKWGRKKIDGKFEDKQQNS